MRKVHESYSLAAYYSKNTSKWDIAENIVKSLDEFGLVRRRMQIELHQWMLSCVLSSVFQDDAEQLEEQIKERFQLQKLVEELLVIAGRRHGKTTCFQLLICSILKNMPRAKIIIFSQGLRNAQEALSGIITMLSSCPETCSMIRRPYSSQKVELVNPYDSSDVRRVLCLPSTGVSTFIVVVYKIVFKVCLNQIGTYYISIRLTLSIIIIMDQLHTVEQAKLVLFCVVDFYF